MRCKKCNREFHYCTSCDFDYAMFEGYCTDSCMKCDLDYAAFYALFKKLLRGCDSCFERDVLRDSKEYLWTSWVNRESERLKRDNY